MEHGYFTDESMMRRVYRERALVLAGPRALLMQAAHPLAVSGLLAHSSALEEPYEAVNFITIALLPPRIRAAYSFRPLPPTWVRQALVSGGAEYVKRVVIPVLPERLRLVPAAARAA